MTISEKPDLGRDADNAVGACRLLGASPAWAQAEAMGLTLEHPQATLSRLRHRGVPSAPPAMRDWASHQRALLDGFEERLADIALHVGRGDAERLRFWTFAVHERSPSHRPGLTGWNAVLHGWYWARRHGRSLPPLTDAWFAALLDRYGETVMPAHDLAGRLDADRRNGALSLSKADIGWIQAYYGAPDDAEADAWESFRIDVQDQCVNHAFRRLRRQEAGRLSPAEAAALETAARRRWSELLGPDADDRQRALPAVNALFRLPTLPPLADAGRQATRESRENDP